MIFVKQQLIIEKAMGYKIQLIVYWEERLLLFNKQRSPLRCLKKSCLASDWAMCVDAKKHATPEETSPGAFGAKYSAATARPSASLSQNILWRATTDCAKGVDAKTHASPAETRATQWTMTFSPLRSVGWDKESQSLLDRGEEKVWVSGNVICCWRMLFLIKKRYST